MEMLTIYDTNLNPIGERSREEVHDKGLLHQTVRLWLVYGDKIWFQQRAMSKTLFPGLLDPASTGHIDASETPVQAVLREANEEIGLAIPRTDLQMLGDIAFGFVRPDGKLDNERTNVFLYHPTEMPTFILGDEVSNMFAVPVDQYDRLVGDSECAEASLYFTSTPNLPVTVWKRDFCFLNREEWELVKSNL